MSANGRPPHVHAVPPRPPKSAASPEELEAVRAADLARIGRFLARIQESGFFGKVTLSMQNGKIVDVRTEQVLRLEEL